MRDNEKCNITDDLIKRTDCHKVQDYSNKYAQTFNLAYNHKKACRGAEINSVITLIFKRSKCYVFGFFSRNLNVITNM